MAFSNGGILNDVTMVHMNNGVKRKRMEGDLEDNASSSSLIKKGRSFITISSSAGLYHSEVWTSKDTTIFIAMSQDTTIRVLSFDQITYPSSEAAENYFIGDQEERYMGTVSGRVIHLWRYSDQKERLFIARSLLCTNDQFYDELCRTLTDY